MSSLLKITKWMITLRGDWHYTAFNIAFGVDSPKVSMVPMGGQSKTILVLAHQVLTKLDLEANQSMGSYCGLQKLVIYKA